MTVMDKEKFEKHIQESTSYSDASRKLYGNIFCGNRQVIKKYVRLYNINVDHFIDHGKSNGYNFKKRPLSEILKPNSYFSTTNLKNRLYKEGLKTPICEKCGQDEWWRGEKISLILDHINGNTSDLTIENLRILCPNCNATLPTHGGKNVYHPKKEKIKKKRKYIVPNTWQRKVKRPEFEQLKNEIKELGYCGTGRKYGVSDNAIRKWIKFYEKHNVLVV